MHNYTRAEPGARTRAGKRPAADYVHDVLAETNKNTLLPDRTKRRKWLQKVSTCTTTQGAEQHLPASLHTVEKDELCSYLNLVNLQPMSKVGNENLHHFNRRSHRLRNNLLLQEKKQLEKSLQSEAQAVNTNTVVIAEEVEVDVEIENLNHKEEDICLDIKSVQQLFNGQHGEVLSNLVTKSSTDICCLNKAMDNNNETECNRIASKPKPKHKVHFAEYLEGGSSPPRAKIEIAAYKSKVQAEQNAVSIIQKKKMVASPVPEESRVPIASHFVTRIQPVQPESRNKSKLTELKNLRQSQNTEVCFDKFHREIIEKEIDAKKDSQIIGVHHVASKAGPSYASLPSHRSTIVVNNCEFVDMTRRNVLDLEVLRDHTYCSSEESVHDSQDASPVHNSRCPERRVVQAPHRNRAISTSADHAAILPQNSGTVIGCYYADYHLVVAQTQRVSFFQQSGLGMFLESQAMWITRGGVARLQFDSSYVRKTARDCVLHSPDHGVAYVELFCKEHNHDSCMVPGCDLFVVLYYRSNTDHVPRCKLHQLEKFTGYAKHVNFVVAHRLNCVTVYYEPIMGTISTSATKCNITSYRFSADYQTVSVYEHQKPPHRIESLHVVEDDDRMVVGCERRAVSFWNAQDLVYTIELPGDANHVRSSFRCDRGFIFALQNLRHENRLRMTAINVSDYSHKSLQVYRPPFGYNGLKHACMREGEVVAFYKQGRVCWNMETGRLISNGAETRLSVWPYGSWLIYVRQRRVYVRRMFKAMRRRLKRPRRRVCS